jgi:hypothetical protein
MTNGVINDLCMNMAQAAVHRQTGPLRRSADLLAEANDAAVSVPPAD